MCLEPIPSLLPFLEFSPLEEILSNTWVPNIYLVGPGRPRNLQANPYDSNARGPQTATRRRLSGQFKAPCCVSGPPPSELRLCHCSPRRLPNGTAASSHHPSHFELRMYEGQDRQHSLQMGHWVNHPLGRVCFNLTHSKAQALCTENGGSQHAVEDVTACYRRQPAVEGPTPLLPRGGPVCGLEEVYPPSSSALPCNSPSRPWPDGFQMLCSQQRPSAPPKATVLASS